MHCQVLLSHRVIAALLAFAGCARHPCSWLGLDNSWT